MKAAPLLVLGLALALPQDNEQIRRALDIVRKADGKIEFDDKAPGKPVVAINL